MLDPLTLDQMRVLIAIAEAGSFSAAARRLRRVQSAVSQAVQALETTLRLPLFDRSSKVPRLTEAGQAVLLEARRVVEGAEALRARADAIRGGLEPELTIFAHQFLPTGPGMRSLRALNEAFPGLPVTLLSEASQDAERHLRGGTADLAIYPYNGPYNGGDVGDLEAEVLTEIEMIPVVAPAHALAAHPGTLTRRDLGGHVQLVLVDGGEAGSRARGIVGDRLWRFANIHAQRGFIMEGFGWGYLPKHFVSELLASGKLQRLRLRQEGSFRLELHVVHVRSRPPGPAAQWAIARLREILSAEAAAPAWAT
ncbi:LysR family transcriptional regulator [Roseomonas populi]|uniref:LysR family transcriptional regulator n=1 Tax=Roseomonas populi TaxID=3121582 RepID=A0ABT1XA83_9PROT|nr:LysR family transcriptional regulator [Roseomonas pecuniae]MCR0985015.1 LysR family transcriptional regulator [Roseomonas pecuniae]